MNIILVWESYQGIQCCFFNINNSAILVTPVRLHQPLTYNASETPACLSNCD